MGSYVPQLKKYDFKVSLLSDKTTKEGLLTNAKILHLGKSIVSVLVNAFLYTSVTLTNERLSLYRNSCVRSVGSEK